MLNPYKNLKFVLDPNVKLPEIRSERKKVSIHTRNSSFEDKFRLETLGFDDAAQ
jgi:hypothetical protein